MVPPNSSQRTEPLGYRTKIYQETLGEMSFRWLKKSSFWDRIYPKNHWDMIQFIHPVIIQDHPRRNEPLLLHLHSSASGAWYAAVTSCAIFFWLGYGRMNHPKMLGDYWVYRINANPSIYWLVGGWPTPIYKWMIWMVHSGKYHQNIDDDWEILVGGWALPLRKIWYSQEGWWNSQ